MASYFWPSSSQRAPPRTAPSSTTNNAAAAVVAPRVTSSIHSSDEVDDFDLIDDEIRLQLTSNRTGTRSEVRAKLSWGLYLRAIFQEPQPITISYGTPEAHKVLETFFTESPERWEDTKKDMERTPALLIEVLEYAAGLQSNAVFREACSLFGRMFQSLTQGASLTQSSSALTASMSASRPPASLVSNCGPLPWPLDTSQKVVMCGEAIRQKFNLTCEESMKSEKKVKELVRYFSSANSSDITHSTFGQKEPMANDADFNKTLDECDPFRQRDWQHDDKATHCPSCNRQFVSGYSTFLTGVYASHCRVCGLRKCRDCTPFKVDKSIARLSKPGGGEEPQMRKACVDCYRKARNMQRFAFLGQAFVYAGLDIVQISMLRTVNQTWGITAELILHGLRAAVYEFTTALSVQGVLESQGIPQHYQHLVDREPSQFTTISKAASPEAARDNSLLSRSLLSTSSSAPSNSGAVPLRPVIAAVGGGGVSSRGKTLTSAVNASIRQLYQSSAKLFVGHPEHIIMMFSLLDWNNTDDVRVAIAVLRQTTDTISAASGSRRRHRHRTPSTASRGTSVDGCCPQDGESSTDALGQWSHWHLLCSRSCNSMTMAMFGVRMLDALQRAPICAAQDDATEMVVASLLKEPHHDAALAAILVPLLLDMCQNKGTMFSAAQSVLGHLASTNPALGLQMICDHRSRETPASHDSFYEGKQFATFIQEAVRSGSSDHHRRAQHGDAQQSGGDSTQQQNNKFILAERFLEALQECLISFQKNRIEDPVKIKHGLLHAFQSKGLVKEVGPTTTTVAPTTESPPPALTSRHGRSTSITSTSSSAASADAAVAIASFATPDFITTFPFMFPFDKSVTIVGIQLQSVRLMASKIRPVMIPLVDATNRVHRVLWKGEDMRQDYIVCLCGIRLQQILMEKGLYMDRALIPHYRVLPLSQESGLVECVENSTSIQAIVATHQKNASLPVPPSAPRRAAPATTATATEAATTPAPLSSTILASPILSYLYDVSMKVHDNKIKYVGKNFLTSAKFFFLFNYLLNLRDRHRDNVMMTTPGCIFHIDFGMTRNQKTMAEELTTSYVRFDADLEISIAHFMPPDRDGKPRSQADAVNAFMNEVADWYCAIRPFAHDLYLLLRHVVAAKHHIPSQQSISNRNHQSSVAFFNASMTSVTAHAPAPPPPPHFAALATDVFLEEDVDLQLNLEDLFQRHLGEDSARREFVRRVMASRGKERVKDWTYETKKRTTSWLSDVGARVASMMYQK
jgi:hypothetical protein